MNPIIRFLHVLEMLVLLPALIVCWCIFYFSKGQKKAQTIVDIILKTGLSWPFSIGFWLFIIFFLFI